MSYVRKHNKDRYIPDIARKSQDYDPDKQVKLISSQKERYEDPTRPVEKTTQIKADFLTLKKVTPPAIIYNDNNRSKVAIGGVADKLGMIQRNPFHDRPNTVRRRDKDGNNRRDRIIKEKQKALAKQQEKELYDINIKPLIDRGIKVNKVIYINPTREL